MRGRPNPQRSMLAIVDLEERVPKDHPLRRIKAVADAALERLSPEFDRMYASVGRASVPPERLPRPRCRLPCTRYAASAPSAKNSSTTCSTAGSWTWI